MSGNCVYKYFVFEGAQALHSSQSRLCCFVGLLLRDVLNGSTIQLCVDAGKQEQHFYRFTLYAEERIIDFLFIWSFLKSTKYRRKQRRSIKVKLKYSVQVVVEHGHIDGSPVNNKQRNTENRGMGSVAIKQTRVSSLFPLSVQYTICTLNAFVWAIPLNYKPLDKQRITGERPWRLYYIHFKKQERHWIPG